MANLPTSIKNLNTLLGEQLTEGGGGGGGSSDFSTATVTVTHNSNDLYLPLPLVVNNAINVMNYAFPNGTESQLVALYKGKAEVYFNHSYIVTVIGGSATCDEDGVVTITGNCSLEVQER